MAGPHAAGEGGGLRRAALRGRGARPHLGESRDAAYVLGGICGAKFGVCERELPGDKQRAGNTVCERGGEEVYGEDVARGIVEGFCLLELRNDVW